MVVFLTVRQACFVFGGLVFAALFLAALALAALALAALALAVFASAAFVFALFSAASRTLFCVALFEFDCFFYSLNMYRSTFSS